MSEMTVALSQKLEVGAPVPSRVWERGFSGRATEVRVVYSGVCSCVYVSGALARGGRVGATAHSGKSCPLWKYLPWSKSFRPYSLSIKV